MRAFNVYQNGKKIDVVYYSEVMTAEEVTDSLNSRGEYTGEVKAFRSLNSVNIRTVLKTAKTVLFTDDENFNKDITGVKSLKEIKDKFYILGNVKRVGIFGNKYVYRLNSGYNFTITVL